MKLDVTLIVTGVALSIVGGLLTTFLAERRPAGAIWTGFGTIVLLALTVALYLQKHVTEGHARAQEPRFLGRLVPANESAPYVPADAFAVELGDDLQVIGKNDYIVLRRFDKPFLEIKVVSGDLFVSATILSNSGEHIVRIIDNEFQASHERAFRPLQPDPHTLVVRDFDGAEVLSIRFRNPRVVRVLGRFHVDGHATPATITPEDGLILPDRSNVNRYTLDLRNAPPGTAFVAFDR